jgi:hypothetical protein
VGAIGGEPESPPPQLDEAIAHKTTPQMAACFERMIGLLGGMTSSMHRVCQPQSPENRRIGEGGRLNSFPAAKVIFEIR